MGRLVVLIGAICATATLMAGCSSAEVVNNATLQEGVAAGLGAQVGDVWAVSCPDSQPVEAGRTFTCQAVSSGDGASVTITVTEDDDFGNVSWTTVDDSVKVP